MMLHSGGGGVGSSSQNVSAVGAAAAGSFSPVAAAASQCNTAVPSAAGSLYAAGSYNHPALHNHRSQAFAINDLLGKWR